MIKFPIKVYILDDDPSILLLIEQYLKSIESVETKVFTDTEEAMTAIIKKPCHIFITDIHLPGINGAEVVKDCLSLHQGIQVIVISGDESLDLARQCYLLGAQTILTKPFQRGEIRGAVKSCLANIIKWKAVLSERQPDKLRHKIKSLLSLR